VAQPCLFHARRRTPGPKRGPSGARLADAVPTAEAGGARGRKEDGGMNGEAQGREQWWVKAQGVTPERKRGMKR
jgi:hypothetical protein